MWRRVALIVVLAGLLAGCSSGATVTQFCSVGPCPVGPHHWTAKEIARDVESNPFPPQNDQRDHPYRVSCRITRHETRAICVGRRRFGSRPPHSFIAEGLLRQNGTWSLLCWPNPSELCDPVQVREQKANPITS